MWPSPRIATKDAALGFKSPSPAGHKQVAAVPLALRLLARACRLMTRSGQQR